MAHDSDRRAISADIPDEAVQAALDAVEGRGPSSEEAGATSAAPEGAAPGADALEAARAGLTRAEARAAELGEQLAAEHDRLLRAVADAENQRKRAAREREDVQRYGVERLVKELLPALDGLDRALAAAPKDDPLGRGVEMVRRLLEDALARHGVKGFSARGEAFDPRLHEALMTIATADAPPGTIVDEQQRGFFLHERLIRPAAVVVACPVVPAAPAEGAADVTAPAGGPAAGPEDG